RRLRLADGAGMAAKLPAVLSPRQHFGANREPEARALARFADHADLAAQELGQAADDRQPEPGAAVFPGSRAIDLRKRLEQQGLLLGRHAGAAVDDRKFEQRMPALAPDLGGL